MSNLTEITGGLVTDECEMTPDAIKSDESMGLPLYSVAKIYADPEFNCRGDITASTVVDLAKSIAKDGLQEPIIIIPRRPDTPEGYDYIVAAGHRRHKAYLVNKRHLIPAILRADIDEFEARTINAIENLQRSNLTMLQEAWAIRPYVQAGWGRGEISTTLNVSEGWVQIRSMILALPKELQEAVGAGYFTQGQVRELHGIKDLDKQLLAAKRIKEAKQRGESIQVEMKISKERRPNQKRIRKRAEIFLLMEEIQKSLGNGFWTRCLAWAAGQIADIELHNSLREECAKKGIEYEIPLHLISQQILAQEIADGSHPLKEPVFART